MPKYRAFKWPAKLKIKLKISTFISLLGALLILSSLSGCQSLSYYSQSAIGHTRLMVARQPVDKAITRVDAPIAAKLRLSKSVLVFAETELDLPVGRSYRSFVEQNREFPVWVVVAAPEFSLEAKQWCYLVIGCAAYRGYFSKSRALAYAEQLQQRGWQTHVGGAAAYSTLGWFADPILPSMMRGGDAAFVEVLLHELAHKRMYVNNQSAFNEAFATFVGEVGATRFISANQPSMLAGYKRTIKASRQFSLLMSELKTALSLIYQSASSAEQKRAARKYEVSRFRSKYAVMKEVDWQGRGYFDNWIATDVNNAKLASYSTYHYLLPKFESLFERCGKDFERFFRILELENVSALKSNCEVEK